MNLYESIKKNLNEAGRINKTNYIDKLSKAGFSKFYFDDWFDYNEDTIKELFKKNGPKNYKNYGEAIYNFASDLLIKNNGKDLRSKKVSDDIDEDFEEWLGLYEDKALNDYKGNPDEDKDAYMKYLKDIYNNHGDKYLEESSKIDYVDKLIDAGFDKFYYDDWFDYNEDTIKELFKKNGPKNYKNYNNAINNFASDLLIKNNGKDLKSKKVSDIDKDFEEWLSLYEDKALNDYKGNLEDKDAYMKYLKDIYNNHGDKYLEESSKIK